MTLSRIEKHAIRINSDHVLYAASGEELYVLERGDPDRTVSLGSETEVDVFTGPDGLTLVDQPLYSQTDGSYPYYTEGSVDLYAPGDPYNKLTPWEAVSAADIGGGGGGTGGRARLVGYGAVEFYGHSIYETGASNPQRGIPGRVSSTLNAENLHRGLPGARLATSDLGVELAGGDMAFGDGGWGQIFRYAEPGTHAAPYEARRDAAVLFYGANEFFLGSDPSAAAWDPFERTLKTVVSRLRASSVFQYDHSSISTTGTWTNQTADAAAAKMCSGAGYKRTTSSSGQVSIAVPADYGGQPIALMFLSDASARGARWDCKVDGGATVQVDTRGSHPSGLYWTPAIFRVTGLAAGAHTITATVSALDTYGYFNCWWIEGEIPPAIAVCNVVDDGDRTNAQAVAANNRITAALSGFDSKVFVVDLKSAISTSDLSDTVHFNDMGCGKAAAAIVDGFEALNRTTAQHSRAAAEGTGNSRGPTNDYQPLLEQARASHPGQIIRRSRRAVPSPSGAEVAPLTRWEDQNAARLADLAYGGQFNSIASVNADNGSQSAAVNSNFLGYPVLLFVRAGVVDTLYPSASHAFTTTASIDAPNFKISGSDVATKTYADAVPNKNLGTRFVHPVVGDTSLAPGANMLVYGVVVVPVPTTLTGIGYWVGDTSNGNVRSGLFTPDNAVVKSRTSNSAQPTANTLHLVAFDSTYAAAAGYFAAALVFSSATGTARGGKSLNLAGNATQGSFQIPLGITFPTSHIATSIAMFVY